MLDIQSQLRFSDHRSLYDILIPADSRFRQLNKLINFSLIRNELVRNYRRNIGRKAVDPMILFEYLLQRTINQASDRDLVARLYTDMSYKYFLGLNLEDAVVDPSPLTVFRRRRMENIDLIDLLIRSTIDKAKALGLLSSKKMMVNLTIHHQCSKDTLQSEAISRMSHDLLATI